MSDLDKFVWDSNEYTTESKVRTLDDDFDVQLALMDQIELEAKFNDNHDELGRFSSGDGSGGASGSTSPAASSADQMVSLAAHHEGDVTPLVSNAANQAGGEMKGLQNKFKTPESLQRKITSDAADLGVTHDQAAARIVDSLRYTAAFPADKYSEGVAKVADDLKSKGYTFDSTRIKNTWLPETNPYRGLNTTVVAPDGYRFELQFHTPESLDVKSENHVDYEEARAQDTSPERKMELGTIMADRASQIPTPPGVADLTTLLLK